MIDAMLEAVSDSKLSLLIVGAVLAIFALISKIKTRWFEANLGAVERAVVAAIAAMCLVFAGIQVFLSTSSANFIEKLDVNVLAEASVGVELRRIIAEINFSFYSELRAQLQRFQERQEPSAALKSADTYLYESTRMIRMEQHPIISTHSARSVVLLGESNRGLDDFLDETIVVPLKKMQEIALAIRKASSMTDQEVLMFYLDYIDTEARRWHELRDELRKSGRGYKVSADNTVQNCAEQSEHTGNR